MCCIRVPNHILSRLFQERNLRISDKLLKINDKYGGESGIRTHVRVSPKHAFQACAFSHSAISPCFRMVTRTVSKKSMHALEEPAMGFNDFIRERPYLKNVPRHDLLERIP